MYISPGNCASTILFSKAEMKLDMRRVSGL